MSRLTWRSRRLIETNVSGTLDSFLRFCLVCPLIRAPIMDKMEIFGAFPEADYHCKS